MIGIIGAGNMGKAIASGINKKVLINDVVSSRLRSIRARYVKKSKNNIDLVRCSDIIILAVKPQDIKRLLLEVKPYTKGKLIVSIAAGVKISFIEKILGRVRVVRVMPNMAALVGKGISGIARGRFAARKDVDIVRKIFMQVGDVVLVKEKSMDAVTALSGSGPAYYFLFTDMLEKAGQAIGLKKDIARQLARATFIGAAASSSATKISMQDFVKKVASKGGTTEAALKVFKKKGLERIVKQAIKAAHKKSKALC